MKELLKNVNFWFDYYVGYMLYSHANDNRKWTTYMLTKYPERYPNEIKYLQNNKK